MSNVDRFMAARGSIPYTRRHVEEIEAHVTAAGIPFCDECCDWHYPDDEHSTTDADKG